MTIPEESTAKRILSILLTHRRRTRHGEACTAEPCLNCMKPHLNLVVRHVRESRPVELALPAFPVKSPNLNKVLGSLLDKAEEIVVRFLDGLCEQISEVYEPGARITICADGRVFAEQIGVPDTHVGEYQRANVRFPPNSGQVFKQLSLGLSGIARSMQG